MYVVYDPQGKPDLHTVDASYVQAIAAAEATHGEDWSELKKQGYLCIRSKVVPE